MPIAFFGIHYTKKFGIIKLCDHFISCFSVVVFTLYCFVQIAWVKADSDFGDLSSVIRCFRKDNTVDPVGGLAYWYENAKFYHVVKFLFVHAL